LSVIVVQFKFFYSLKSVSINYLSQTSQKNKMTFIIICNCLFYLILYPLLSIKYVDFSKLFNHLLTSFDSYDRLV